MERQLKLQAGYAIRVVLLNKLNAGKNRKFAK